MAKKGENVKFKNYTRKIKLPFIIYGNFEIILVPKYNRKQNQSKTYTNKYQNDVGCSFGYKIVCADDQFSKPFKSYLGEDAFHKFITNMTEESKYCRRVMKEHFTNELIMTKGDGKNFESSTKGWTCDDNYVEVDFEIRDHCHTTGKCRTIAHRDCNMNVSVNYKIPIIFCNLKNYDVHLITEELDKFDFKINVTQSGFQKYMSCSLANKLVLINSFQFLSSLLDSLVKNLVLLVN